MMLRIDIHRLSRIFKMAAIAMETTTNTIFLKLLGIEWNFPEIVSDMCTHNFEA